MTVQTAPGAETITAPDLSAFDDMFPYEEPDDSKDHKTHIINPPMNLHIWQPGMESKEIVEIARISGLEITALCGYVFVPKLNPEKLDICRPCMAIAGEIMRNLGE